MHTKLTGPSPVPSSQSRLSAADRALLLALAERDLAQGRITTEEYQYTQDQCRVHPGAAAVQRLLRLAGHGGVARFPFGEPDDPVLRTLPPRLETIPVNAVIGSTSRAAYLDRRFRPLHGGRARLESIRAAMAAGAPFLPIEVYRLDGGYYVIDGHHRVAAALQVGQLHLDAMVTECWMEPKERTSPLGAARAAFSELTGLLALSLSTPARYEQALQQIQEHRWYLGEHGRVLDLAWAAQAWYQTVCLPVVQQLVAGGLAPRRGQGEIADRYFELSDLRERISRERGQDIGVAEALRLWTARRGRHGAFGRSLGEVRMG